MNFGSKNLLHVHLDICTCLSAVYRSCIRSYRSNFNRHFDFLCANRNKRNLREITTMQQKRRDRIMERQHCHMSFDVFYVQTSRHYVSSFAFVWSCIEAFSLYVWFIHKYITCKLRYMHSTSHYIMCFL